jgi:ribosome biogenesis protein Nip4
MKASTSINKDNLLHCGTCLGKFTKSGKFRLHITALDYLAQYSKVSFIFDTVFVSVIHVCAYKQSM